MKLKLILLCLVCGCPFIARAEPGDELSVYLMTIGPGDEVFEKFGHNMIRIVDRSAGVDVAYNWGVFDFRAKNFFLNYALGRMDYSAQRDGFADAVEWYKSFDRAMWQQELNLTPAQKLKLLQRCQEWDGKTYRYNYYTDNCSTKIRDILDEVLDGEIKKQLSPNMTETTWRWHTRRLTRDSVLWYTILNTALGPAVDRKISQWEEGFLPVQLSAYLEKVTINGAPVVKAREEIYQSTRPPEATAPPNWIVQYFLVGAAAGGLMAAFAWRGWRKSFIIAATICSLILGICGALGLWAWFFTAHWATWRNENLFGYKPLALALVVLVPMMWKRRPKRATVWIALIVAASTVLGVLLSLVLPQANGEAMALVLPINVALAWGIWRMARNNQQSPVPSP